MQGLVELFSITYYICMKGIEEDSNNALLICMKKNHSCYIVCIVLSSLY